MKRLEWEVAAPKVARIGKPEPCFGRPAEGSETIRPRDDEALETSRHK